MGNLEWTNRNPLVYYPWKPVEVTSSMHHEIIVEQWDILKSWYTSEPKEFVYYFGHFHAWQWQNWWKTLQTTDNKTVSLLDLYPDTRQLSEDITSDEWEELRQCYVLSLFNPAQPHFRPVDCSKKILHSLFCEKIVPNQNFETNVTAMNVEEKNNYGQVKCGNGEYISTLYICDGHRDCRDGSDERNCSCFVHGKIIRDNIFCSQTCSKAKNCVCAVLFTHLKSGGCHSYSTHRNYKEVKPKYTSNGKKVMKMCKNATIKIHPSLVDDLIFDCPFHDDEMELQNIHSEKAFSCHQNSMKECYPGHRQCYTQEEECVYNLTREQQTLMYCRNGEHLQDCEKYNCTAMLKCANSYCIPFRYVCDGRWDCWHGDDEKMCKNYSCVQMFKCRYHSTCIHIENVCDERTDCPLEDDEKICEKMECVKQCTCLNYGITCKDQNFIGAGKFLLKMMYFVFISISESKVPNDRINVLSYAERLLLNHNNLTQPLRCDSAGPDINIKVLEMSFNKIFCLKNNHFTCLPNLNHLVLKHNKISEIVEHTFKSLSKLVTLDLQQNEITSLGKCSFCGTKDLNFINLLQNNIFYVGSKLFSGIIVKSILTDRFHICCMYLDINFMCTAKPIWPSSCEALLSNLGLKVVSWVVGFVVTVFNIISGSSVVNKWVKSKELKHYDRQVLLINACDLTVGLYLLTVAIKDAVAGGKYVESDLKWRSGVICKAIAFLSLWSVVVEALLMMTLGITRYRIVKDPFEKPMSKGGNIFIMAFLPLIFASLIVVVILLRHIVEGYSHLSSPLCILLGKTDQSIVQFVVTLTVAVYLLSVLSVTLVFYCKLICHKSPSDAVLNEPKKQERQRGITRNVILAGVTNILCWIPSSVFYLVSVSLETFPVALLYWMALVVVPINAMMNPIVLRLSDIKSKLKEIKDKLKKQSENQ